MNGKAPRTEAEFLRHYRGHSKEELLHAVSGLHVANITQMDQCRALRDALASLILFTKPSKTNAVALNHAHQVLKTR